LAEPNLVLIKDSSVSSEKRDAYLAHKREGVALMSGDEFNVTPYITAGYSGVMLGGAIFNGALTRRILDALDDAERLQSRMNDLMWIVYGGKKITCWLSGLKYLLTRMGVFSGIHNIPA